MKPFELIPDLMFIQAKDKTAPFTDNLSKIHCSVSYLEILYKKDHKPVA